MTVTSGEVQVCIRKRVGGAILALAALAGATVRAADWNQWRGPNRDGVSPERGWTAAWSNGVPKVLWKTPVGKGLGSVSVSGKRAYVMGNIEVGEKEVEGVEKKTVKGPDGKEVVTENKVIRKEKLCEDTVFCLDTETGAVLWKRGWPQALDPSGYEGGPCSTPCVDGKRVYALGRTGRVTCLDAATGDVVWEYMPEKPCSTTWAGISASPLLEGNLLISSSMAFDKETGKVAWSAKHGCSWSSPLAVTLAGKRLILFFSQGGLAAVNPADGAEAWFLPWGSDQNVADPIVVGDKVFLSSRRNGAKAEQCALVQPGDKEPTVVWKNGHLPSYFHVRVLVDGYVYGCDDGNLKCLDPKTGELKWAADGGGGQVIASDGKLIIGRGGALVVAEASPEGYKVLAQTKVNVCVPVLSGGRIYCHGGGEVTCLDVPAPAARQ